MRKHRDIKFVTTYNRGNQLVSELSHHATKWFSETLLAIEIKKTKVKMNKPVYLGFSISEVSKTLMYEFWYDYIKLSSKTMQNYATWIQIVLSLILKQDFYKDIANDVEKRFDTSNYENNRPLPIGKNKKVIGLMKNELGGKIMVEFVALRPKTYSYLMDDDSESKKTKGTKKCVRKKVLKLNDYIDCLLNKEIILKSQQRFKSESHNVYTQEVNKIALSSYDDKKLQTYDRITSYPYGTRAGKYVKQSYLAK